MSARPGLRWRSYRDLAWLQLDPNSDLSALYASFLSLEMSKFYQPSWKMKYLIIIQRDDRDGCHKMEIYETRIRIFVSLTDEIVVVATIFIHVIWNINKMCLKISNVC